MHAAEDGVYHVQLGSTIPTCTYIHYSKKCFARPGRVRKRRSVRVIDGELFIFTLLSLFMQGLQILCTAVTPALWTLLLFTLDCINYAAFVLFRE